MRKLSVFVMKNVIQANAYAQVYFLSSHPATAKCHISNLI